MSSVEILEQKSSEPKLLEDDESVSIITSHPQNRNQQNLPIKIQVQYNKGILGLNINCGKVQKSPFAYTRHYLVFDFKTNMEEIYKVKNQYFKHIPKGDLLMYRGCFNNQIKISAQKWIQKTIKSKTTIEGNDKMERVDNQVYEQSKQYKDLIIVSLFIDGQATKSMADDIKNSIILKNTKYPSLKKYTLTKQTEPENEPHRCIIDFVELKASNMSEIFKAQMEQLKKVKLSELFLQLSTNGHLHQKRNNYSNKPSWFWKQQKLTKSIYQIKDQQFQEQFLLMRSSENQSLQIFVEISFVSLLGDKYITSGYLQILSPKTDRDEQSYNNRQAPSFYNFRQTLTNYKQNPVPNSYQFDQEEY